MTILGRIGVLREQLGQRFDVAEYAELQRLELAVGIVLAPGEPAGLTVTGIEPTSAVVGDPDLILSVYGTGFTADTVMLFNHGEEPTTYVSPHEVTTLLKPSTASGPVTVPVSVVGASTSADFTFTS